LTIQKFFINIKIIVEDFVLETIALFDTGVDSNFILEGLILGMSTGRVGYG